jgi:hypothetical protein
MRFGGYSPPPEAYDLSNLPNAPAGAGPGAQEAGTPQVPQGWRCPACRRVYAPWVACCAACPGEQEPSREITEN